MISNSFIIFLKYIGAEAKKYTSSGLVTARKEGETSSSMEPKIISPKAYTSAIGSPSISLKPRSTEKSKYLIVTLLKIENSISQPQ